MRLKLSQLPLWTTLLAVLTVLIVLDRLFAAFVFTPLAEWTQNAIALDVTDSQLFDSDALSGIWMALIALALGTLLLVISIASQSIPRLIDLYLGNRLSLLYIWFLILGAAHALLVMQTATVPAGHSIKAFNLLVLLPLGLLMVFPYTCHVLKQSKPDHIINQIYQQIQRAFSELVLISQQTGNDHQRSIARLQGTILESFNQLDDVLSYITFKGPRAEIISLLGQALREYIRIKPMIPAAFFQMTPAAQADISFMTIADPNATVVQTQTLIEQKIMRLLRNAYAQTTASSDYDLASLCMKELQETCRVIIQNAALDSQTSGMPASAPMNTTATLDFFLVWFNTFLRVAIKDAEKVCDIRNLFNLLFYYGQLAGCLVVAQRTDTLRTVFRYLRIYGEELYNKSRRDRFLEFAVDVVAAEMSKVLRQIHADRWPTSVQIELLKVLMSVDRQHGLRGNDEDPQAAISLGVRLIQMGLALYYLDHGFDDAVALILEDLKQDFTALGRERYRKVFEVIMFRLRVTNREFWEDTDRGNESLYFAPQKHRLDDLRQQIEQQFGLLT